jgi:hypothetical protein
VPELAQASGEDAALNLRAGSIFIPSQTNERAFKSFVKEIFLTRGAWKSEEHRTGQRAGAVPSEGVRFLLCHLHDHLVQHAQNTARLRRYFCGDKKRNAFGQAFGD